MSQYKIQIAEGNELIFKLIPAEDCDRFFQAISKDENPYVEEFIFNYVTESRYKNEQGEIDLPAGIIPTVVYYSLTLSGIIKSKIGFVDAIEEARNRIQSNPYFGIYSKIIKAIPNTDPDKLKELTLNELLDRFALAELVMGGQLVDTKKQREAIEKEQTGKGGSAKKGISAFTKEEIESLKAAIQADMMEI